MLTSRDMLRLGIILILVWQASAAQAAENVTGRWMTEDKSAVISIAPCGIQMCGTIAQLLVNTPGMPRTDVNNPDPALRSRPLEGLRIISGLSRNGVRWEGGRIYDPLTGKSYKSYLQLTEGGVLKVAGCLAFICRAQRWTRAR